MKNSEKSKMAENCLIFCTSLFVGVTFISIFFLRNILLSLLSFFGICFCLIMSSMASSLSEDEKDIEEEEIE